MDVDMSAQAVTNRMLALDQLWELAVALKSSEIVEDTNEDDANADQFKPDSTECSI